MAANTRQRMVEAAAELLQRGGMGAASFTDVLSVSGGARGAIYHHFPDGKTELTRAAVVWTGQRVQANLASLEGANAVEVVDAFLASIRPVVADAAAGTSCAVAAVVVETGQVNTSLTGAAHTALQSWIATLEARMVAAGAARTAARSVAVSMITFLEGAQVLCRAAGDLAPFDEGVIGVRVVAEALLAPSAGS